MSKNPKVYLDVTVDEVYLGRIVILLFENICPKTCKNFIAMCEGTTFSPAGDRLHYKSSKFHRVIKGFMIQSGDSDITGNESIYGENFEDENFILDHFDKGLVSLANRGPNTNGSGFFITTVPCDHLNRKHCVFGKVVSGYDDVVATIENCETNDEDCPLKTIIISACGILHESH